MSHEQEFEKAASIEEFRETTVKVVQVGKHEIALFQVDGRYYAVSNVCPHRGGPIGEGRLEDLEITCPWHDWGFDLRTGECVINPAACLDRFEVKLEGEAVLVSTEPC